MRIKPFLSIMMILLPLVGEGYWSQCNAEEVRLPAVAGAFYPASANELRRNIKAYLDSVPEIVPAGKIYAAVAPHAGYIYSGGVAAYTHKVLSTVDFHTLIIIGHDTHQNAVAFTCPADYFQTPLGKVPVDREMMAKMHALNGGIKANWAIHAREHTVEIHLPFLQVLGRPCKIIPILFGNPTRKNCQILADAIIRAAGDKRVLVLASADMSHYPPYDLAYKVDKSTLEVLKSLDVERLFTHLAAQEGASSVPNLRTALCAKGGVGTAVLFARAHGADGAQILRYANSGDVRGGDRRGVVGYSSVLFVKKGAP
jgi:AmmeMemoRadiSam system protein B